MQIVDLGSGFAQEPVEIRGAWHSRQVTARHPVAGEHLESWVEIKVSCSTSPLLAALLLRGDDKSVFGRVGRSAAANDVEVRLAFLPYSFYKSDDVQVSLFQHAPAWSDGIRVAVRNHQLKLAPTEVVEVLGAESLVSTTTGTACRVAELVPVFAADLIILSKQDTRNSHGRWRVDPAKAANLPRGFEFLLLGRRSGTT
jgi:hypothetical protein